MENDNKITKVIFYEMELEGEKFFESAIFRNNRVKLADIEKGIDALQILAKEKGVKDIKTLQNTDYFEVLSEEKFEEKYPKVYHAAKCKHEDEELSHNKNSNEPHEENSEDDTNELLRSLKIKNLILKTSIYCIVGGMVLVGAYNIGKKVFRGKDNDENENTTSETEYDNTDYSHNETGYEMLQKYGSVDEILKSSNINKTKSNTLSNIWSYLKNYNITVSSKHESSVSDTRLAHTWDEAVVNYLAYNNISNEELTKVFDNYNIDITTFKETYQAGYNQDLLAYTVLQEPTNKVDIINSQEGKDFYQKYENLIIKYNQTYDRIYDNPELDTIANEFYQTVREDFSVNQSKDSIESYKLSVIPIINAFDRMVKFSDYENSLSTEEVTYFNELASFDMIEDKIKDLSSTLYSYNISSDALNENNEEYTYSQIKDAAITQLDLEEAYFVSDSDRDISDHIEYYFKLQYREEEIEVEETNRRQNNNSNNSYNGNYDTTGIINDTEEEEEIPDWMIDENNQDTVYTDETTEENTTQDNTEEEIPDWIIDDNDQDDYIYDVEEDTPNKSSLNEGSKEVIADYIINEMVNSPSSEKSNNSKILTK